MKRIFFSSTLMWSAPLQDMAQVVQDNQLAGIEVWAQHFFYHQYDKAAYREYASKFQIETFVHSCSWDLNLASLNEGIRQASVQEVVASLRLAKELGAAEVTVHPGHMTMPFWPRTSVALFHQSLEQATGFTSQWQNIGKIQNKGIELSITSTNIQTKEFTWNTNFNISFIRNELKALADGASHMYARSGFDSNFTSYDYIAKVGESLGLIYGYEFDGVYQYDDFYTDTNGNLVLKPGITQNSRYSKDKKVGARPGVTKYKDQDGDGDITTNDRTVIGNAMPKWFGGITNTFEYKGFDLSFMFQFNYGNDIYNATRLYATQSRSGRRNMLAEVADRWSPTNASNVVPAYDGYITNDVYSRFVEDGSFLRLKNLTLGYTLPKKWTNKFHASRLRVYATGQNLFCLSNYSGYDPEVNSLNNPMMPGLDWGAYPKSRVFTVGIDLQF